MDDELFTPEQEAYIKKLIRSNTPDMTIEGRAQISSGLLNQLDTKVDVVYDGNGAALPGSGSFTKVFDDSTLLFFVAGSGFNAAAGATTQAYYKVQVRQIGVNAYGAQIWEPDPTAGYTAVLDTQAYSNEASSHKSHGARLVPYPDPYYPTGTFRAGTYNCQVAVNLGSADVNDLFRWTVVELPSVV